MRWLTHLSDIKRYSNRWTTRKIKVNDRFFWNFMKTPIKQVIIVNKTNYIENCNWPSVVLHRRQTSDDCSNWNIKMIKSFSRFLILSMDDQISVNKVICFCFLLPCDQFKEYSYINKWLCNIYISYIAVQKSWQISTFRKF